MRLFGKRIMWLRCLGSHHLKDNIAVGNDLAIFPCEDCNTVLVYARTADGYLVCTTPQLL